MATWQDYSIPIVRTLISDSVTSTSYSDSRLEETLVHCAFIINQIVDFEYDYTVNIAETSITPDPIANTDNDFIMLMSLKAASIILQSEVKTMAAQSYRITDGPSTIDVTGVYKATKELADQMTEDLKMALLQYQIGNSKAGQAILGPYTQQIIANGYTFY
jgi:hypothetical protein